MRQKNKGKYLLKRHIILILSVFTFGILGTGYAYWNNNVHITTLFFTGKIEPKFCESYSLEAIQGDGNLRISLEDDTTLTIRGEVYPDYKAFLHYCVLNDGTLPIKFDQSKFNELNPNKVDGLQLTLNELSKALEPGDHLYSDHSAPQVHIFQFPKDKHNGNGGTHNFELKLPFRQWTDGFGLWEKYLTIKGEIAVKPYPKGNCTPTQPGKGKEEPQQQSSQQQSSQQQPSQQQSSLQQSSEQSPVEESSQQQSSEQSPVEESSQQQYSEQSLEDESSQQQSSEQSPEDESSQQQSSEQSPEDESSQQQSSEQSLEDESSQQQSSEQSSEDESSQQSSNAESPEGQS